MPMNTLTLFNSVSFCFSAMLIFYYVKITVTMSIQEIQSVSVPVLFPCSYKPDMQTSFQTIQICVALDGKFGSSQIGKG